MLNLQEIEKQELPDDDDVQDVTEEEIQEDEPEEAPDDFDVTEDEKK